MSKVSRALSAVEAEENRSRICLVHDMMLQKISRHQWHVHKTTVQKWLDKAHERMSHYRDLGVLMFQLDETIHYLTLQQLEAGIVPHKAEHAYVIELFKQQSAEEILSSAKDFDKKLQTPEVTFGEKVSGIICKKCKRSEVTMQARQTRSADEPTSYFYQCKDSKCNHRWKDV